MDERKDEIIVGNPTETLLDEQKDVVNAIEENTIDSDSQNVENDVENTQEVNKENEENDKIRFYQEECTYYDS